MSDKNLLNGNATKKSKPEERDRLIQPVDRLNQQMGFELFEKGKLCYKIEDGVPLPIPIATLHDESTKEDILKQNEECDLYYSLAMPKIQEFKKFNKKDILSSDILWADIDREPNEEELNKTKTKLRDLGLEGCYSILLSGTGYWVYLKLNQPCEELARLENVMTSLGNILGADACFNIDRIGRLSGSVNQKNKKTARYLEVSERKVELETLEETLRARGFFKDSPIKTKRNGNESFSEEWASVVSNFHKCAPDKNPDELLIEIKKLAGEDVNSYVSRKGADWIKKDVTLLVDK